MHGIMWLVKDLLEGQGVMVEILESETIEVTADDHVCQIQMIWSDVL